MKTLRQLLRRRADAPRRATRPRATDELIAVESSMRVDIPCEVIELSEPSEPSERPADGLAGAAESARTAEAEHRAIDMVKHFGSSPRMGYLPYRRTARR